VADPLDAGTFPMRAFSSLEKAKEHLLSDPRVMQLRWRHCDFEILEMTLDSEVYVGHDDPFRARQSEPMI
jgi:hypothetical protein